MLLLSIPYWILGATMLKVMDILDLSIPYWILENPVPPPLVEAGGSLNSLLDT